MFRRPTFASAARQARSRCLAASGEREGAGTRDTDLESGLAHGQGPPFPTSLVTLFRPGTAESDLSREINAHLQLLEDQHVADGMSRDEARYAARRTFGGVEQAKEQQRDARSFRWLAGWPMDLKLGARMLVKSPGLTIVAVTALAIAIGAGAAYLELMHDLISPRLPVANADRIVGIRVWNAQRRKEEWRSLQDVAVWRATTRTSNTWARRGRSAAI